MCHQIANTPVTSLNRDLIVTESKSVYLKALFLRVKRYACIYYQIHDFEAKPLKLKVVLTPTPFPFSS